MCNAQYYGGKTQDTVIKGIDSICRLIIRLACVNGKLQIELSYKTQTQRFSREPVHIFSCHSLSVLRPEESRDVHASANQPRVPEPLFLSNKEDPNVGMGQQRGTNTKA